MPRKPRHLSDPAVMLETLKLAYQHALDQQPQGRDDKPRLTLKQEKELGRRLARYWLMQEPITPLITEDDIQEVVGEVTMSAEKAWAAMTDMVDLIKQRAAKRR